MTNATQLHPAYEDATLKTCQAMILCLDTRQFVIVRPDEMKDLWPKDGGWDRIRDVKPGDRVIYKGECAKVRAVEVYR